MGASRRCFGRCPCGTSKPGRVRPPGLHSSRLDLLLPKGKTGEQRNQIHRSLTFKGTRKTPNVRPWPPIICGFQPPPTPGSGRFKRLFCAIDPQGFLSEFLRGRFIGPKYILIHLHPRHFTPTCSRVAQIKVRAAVSFGNLPNTFVRRRTSLKLLSMILVERILFQ